MLRYSLKTLGAAVALIAVACAALLHANAWVASAAWTVLFLLLTMATIVALLTSPQRRGFWTGFALAGWLYLLAGIGPLAGYHHGNLLTTMALHRAASMLPEENNANVPTAINVNTGTLSLANTLLINSMPANANTKSGWITSYPLAQAARAPQPYQSLVDVGQSLWTLLLALLGGWFGAFIAARRRRPLSGESV